MKVCSRSYLTAVDWEMQRANVFSHTQILKIRTLYLNLIKLTFSFELSFCRWAVLLFGFCIEQFVPRRIVTIKVSESVWNISSSSGVETYELVPSVAKILKFNLPHLVNCVVLYFQFHESRTYSSSFSRQPLFCSSNVDEILIFVVL